MQKREVEGILEKKITLMKAKKEVEGIWKKKYHPTKCIYQELQKLKKKADGHLARPKGLAKSTILP